MRLILLPIHLLKFWYPESLVFFVRTWRHSILYLEEGLAVGLMAKLLWVPLYRDSTIIGRVLSLIFRIVRIFFGLVCFTLASFFIMMIALLWLILPIWVITSLFLAGTLPLLVEISGATVFLGVCLFLAHVLTHPHKKIWVVKDNNFWDCSWVGKNDVNYQKILQTKGVQNLLVYLELPADIFSNFNPIIDAQKQGELAFMLAKNLGSEYIGAAHFFVVMLQNYPGIDNFLLKFNLNTSDFPEALLYLQEKSNSNRHVWLWDSDFVIHHLKGVNRGWLGAPTPVLDSVSEDLTKKAAEIGFPQFIGRKSQVSEVINILSLYHNRNVLIVGPPGSGKTTLLNYLARLIVMGDAPASLATKRLVLLDLTRLISGIKTQGELADRVKEIFEEVEFTQNVIIAVEEIHNLGLGEAGSSLNLYSLMAPYLESGQFQFIATTESENYVKTVEKNGSLARLFTKIELPEASEKETVQILKDQAILMAQKTNIKVTFIAIKEAVELAAKLVHNRVLPDSAVGILDEAQTWSAGGWINSGVIKGVVSKRVNVPIAEVGNAQKSQLLNLEEEIHQQLIDQEEAVKVVADTLRRSAAGLRQQNRPIGSFLFVGPTGVGKTELAKILATTYFKNSGAYVRFDMSEYQNSQSVSRLIGGASEAGLLTEVIRDKPYALLLLDEFEKADPKILTLFLQVLEDGRLTDGLGRTIDFTSTIIIATSNAASLIIARGLQAGDSLAELEGSVNNELLTIFTPELLNRFDDVVLFKPLSKDDLQKIVKLKLQELQARLKMQGYVVEFDSKIVAELTKKGYDPVLGARPLRRLIQDTLEAKLSRMILQGKLIKGQVFKAGVESL